jgi:photosystem II stability/assembly factor-like uncharacterized protein
MKASHTLAIAVIGMLHVVADAQAQTSLETAISHLEYRGIGPALMGGRISDLDVVATKPQMFYVATATGGLWKTENQGTSWTSLFDDQTTSSIGDVTIFQANPNLLWIGTGEPQNRQSSPWGNGVYKSTDAGNTWAHMGLAETKHIGRILIHPRNPDIVYVAAVGDLWGPNEERGVFRTRDGGSTWDRVLYIDQHTGAIDLAMDPGDPNTIFAAMYQRQRTGWGFNGGGPGSGLYRTVDGGENWVELTDGLPEGDKGRIGIDIYRQDGSVVYALVEADAREPSAGFRDPSGSSDGGTFRSLDRGKTWEKMSDTNPRPMYYSQIRIDPSNSDRIYVLATQLMVSDDGGRTFRSDGVVQVHVDHHALWIDPNDSDHLVLGSDGGVSVSWDGTRHWRMFDNIPLAQFYAIGFDMRDPYFVCGGLQDNDAWCGPSNTRSFHGIRNQDWYETAYGDGFFTIVDPTDSTIVFSESQGGNMNRYDLTTGEKTPMRPITGPRENGDTTKVYRFNWNSPLQLSPHDPATVYLGANYLMRSRDHGMIWEEVGGIDLTKQIDRETLEIMSVPGSEAQLSINDGISTYGNLTTLAESPLVPGLIYVGTDDGNLQVTRDDGSTWENVVAQIPGLPDRTYVSRIEASSHADGRVYATFDGHRNGDYAPYVYLSEDYGQTWAPITSGLPNGWSVNVIVEHHRTPNLLFLGNEVGVYVSVDRGQNWVRFKNNLPVVPVDDILLHPRENDLIVGTHGRGIYIMPDVTPLERLSPDMMAEVGRAFPSRSIMWAERGDWPFYGATFSAPNPPRGARIRYYLRDSISNVAAVDGGNGSHDEADGEDFSLTITDMSGKHVRTLDAPSLPGINEVIWDWRYDPPYERTDDSEAESGGPGSRRGGAPQGPIVMPGNYTVSMEINGESYSSAIEIVAEPRRPMTSGDRIARQNALMSLHVLAKPIHEARQAIDSVNEQLVAVKELIEGADELPEELAEELAAIEEELDAIRDELDTARGYTGVASAIQGSSTLPTEDHSWQVDRAWEVVPDILDRLNVLVLTRVPALNERLYADAVLPTPGEGIDLPARPRG